MTTTEVDPTLHTTKLALHILMSDQVLKLVGDFTVRSLPT